MTISSESNNRELEEINLLNSNYIKKLFNLFFTIS